MAIIRCEKANITVNSDHVSSIRLVSSTNSILIIFTKDSAVDRELIPFDTITQAKEAHEELSSMIMSEHNL